MPPTPRSPTALLALAAVIAAIVGSCKVRKAPTEQTQASATTAVAAGNPTTGPASPAAPWPALSRSAEAAEALVRERTPRPVGTDGEEELTAERILRAGEAAGWTSLVAGERAVVERLQSVLDGAERGGRDAYVLWGTHHDSVGQVAAFRRLVGPGGLRGLTLVAAEQFFASGAWSGVPADAQAGDDTDVDAYVLRGDREAFAALARRHRRSDHAAWTFGYEADVMELPVTARAAHVRFAGCNMPLGAQQLTGLAPLGDGRLLLRLRELHCLLALSRFDSPHRVAMLWGRDHIRADGFPRFVPAGSEVVAVDVFGFRGDELTTEAELAKDLVVLDPLLIPLDDVGRSFALLLPDDVLGADVDRTKGDAEADGAGVRVACSRPGRITVAGRRPEVRPDADLTVEPDAHLRRGGGGCASRARWRARRNPLSCCASTRSSGT